MFGYFIAKLIKIIEVIKRLCAHPGNIRKTRKFGCENPKGRTALKGQDLNNRGYACLPCIQAGDAQPTVEGSI
jgi:hypothetical protein